MKEALIMKEGEITYDKNAVPVAPQEGVKIINKRLFKPRIDHKACKKCMMCVVACPDNCIELSKSENPTINYSCCKGCLICLRECLYGAISEEKEE